MIEYNDLLVLENLTDRQREVIQCVIDEGSQQSAAKKLEISIGSVQSHVSKAKHKHKMAVHLQNFSVPNGYEVQGTSTLVDADGNTKIQWIKTRKEDADRIESLRAAVQEIVGDVEGRYETIPPLEYTMADQMSVYTIGDAHIGMYAWERETGEDFDLDIAEKNLIGAMTRLVQSTPPTETALLVDVGDFFHSDNMSNTTSNSGNQLDVDTRWAKVLKVGLNTMVALVEQALQKHQKVIVRNAIGNHNEHSAIYLALYLASYFRNESRVTVEDSPSMFWYHKFGKNLIGVTHGHRLKIADMGEIMASDCEDIWSETKYRYWYTGHIHHDTVKELRTCKVETFRSLVPKDAWHAASGYRSGRDMKAIILHKEFGEVQRVTCNISMLELTHK